MWPATRVQNAAAAVNDEWQTKW